MLGPYSLLSSAYIVHLSKANERERRSKVIEWMKLYRKIGLIAISNFDLVQMMGMSTLQKKWKSWSLPADHISQENAAILSVLDDKVGYQGLVE